MPNFPAAALALKTVGEQVQYLYAEGWETLTLRFNRDAVGFVHFRGAYDQAGQEVPRQDIGRSWVAFVEENLEAGFADYLFHSDMELDWQGQSLTLTA